MFILLFLDGTVKKASNVSQEDLNSIEDGDDQFYAILDISDVDNPKEYSQNGEWVDIKLSIIDLNDDACPGSQAVS
jgi:hypothetical protein